MRNILLLVPLSAVSLALEQQQVLNAFQGLYDKFKSFVPSNVPDISSAANKAASKLTHSTVVTPLTLDNWRSSLLAGAPSKAEDLDEWFVYITGGNTTCGPRCTNTTSAWTRSLGNLSARPRGPRLASVDCDEQGILCALWNVHPPAIYHMIFRFNDQAHPIVRYIQLNATDVTAQSIIELHAEQKYTETEPYTGYFHPFIGAIAKSQFSLPLAYATYYLSKLPSWAPMLIVSLLSRSVMGRRAPHTRANAGATPGAPGAART